MHHHHTSWLQRSLEKIWYKQQKKGKWYLLPFTLLYCAIHSFQRWKLTRRRIKVNIPVIVVGNISIGGTGKTPTVIYLAKMLKEAGYQPAIITRGYGGKSAKWPRKVTLQSNPKQVGDEAVLLAKRTTVPVVAGPDRYVDIQYLKANYPCDVILSDDGLQHYNLHRDIEIILIDAQRELGNGRCLPAGPLRENAFRLKEVDFVLYNNGFKQKNNRHLVFAKQYQLDTVFPQYLVGEMLYGLKTKKISRALVDLKETTVHAVTGIGNPIRFYNALEQSGLILIKHSFPDHHDFKKNDLVFPDNKLVIMTEKDAVKCREFAPKQCWYLPIEAQIMDDFDQLLLDKLRKKHG